MDAQSADHILKDEVLGKHFDIKIKVSRFREGLYDLLEDAKYEKKSILGLNSIAERYLKMYRCAKNYDELDSTTKEVLNSYHPEIFKMAEQSNQNRDYRLPKSSS